uniref:Uncharacterized protein n=1 Tax=Panagrolaimus sp. PS1159 TaxID=55785 RepID=A0AC35FVP3_9BILA
MKLPLALSFFVALIQLGSSKVLSKREFLSSDEIAVQNGSDVIMVKPGPLEALLNNASELIFGVCEQNCNAEFLVCFEGAFNNSWSTDLCVSKCGFYVDTTENDVTYMKPFSQKNWGLPRKNCTEMIMLHEKTTQTGELPYYPSCLPKVENGIVKLNIMNATSDCVVTIKNAKIKQDEITTLPNSHANSPSNNPSSSAAKNIIGSFGWIFVFIPFSIFHP